MTLIHAQDLPRLGIVPKLGLPPINCWDYGDCGSGSFTRENYSGGVWNPFNYSSRIGNSPINHTAPNCNCLHGTAYLDETGNCRCCEGVVIDGFCTGGIKDAPEPQRACATDVKTCPDSSVVSRDPRNNCEFSLCPQPQTIVRQISGNDILDFIKANPIPSILAGGILAYVMLGSNKK